MRKRKSLSSEACVPILLRTLWPVFAGSSCPHAESRLPLAPRAQPVSATKQKLAHVCPPAPCTVRGTSYFQSGKSMAVAVEWVRQCGA